MQEEYTNLDYSQLMPMEDTITLNISDENILPMGVKSLVHHCSIRDNAKGRIWYKLPILISDTFTENEFYIFTILCFSMFILHINSIKKMCDEAKID